MNAADISRLAGAVAVNARFTDIEIDILLNAKSEEEIPEEIMAKIKKAIIQKKAKLEG